jgi:uncharacterized protein (TIGR02217 family)
MTPYPTRAVVTTDDLADDPEVFPALPGLEVTVTKAPVWDTQIRRSASRREIRIARSSSPLWRFRLRHEFLRDLPAHPELGRILAFFNARLGRFGFFYYLDPEDHTVEDHVFATGDGTTRNFTLSRTINSGGVHVSQDPVYGLWEQPVIKIDGVPASGVTLATWGRVTLASAPASGAELSWSGKFLYVCRFDQDEMDLERLARSLWSQGGLQFMSIKP